jgi:hypothetical protein
MPAPGHAGADGARAPGVVAQAMQDAVEGGQAVVSQTEEPKHQCTCFLRTFAAGAARVPAAAGMDVGCE